MPCEFLASELRTLQLSAAAFFGVLETVFGFPSVGKCRIGFERLMQAFGTEDAVGLVSNCLRRHRTMLREIRGFVRLFRPGQPPPVREKAQAALLPSERYACLGRVKEPHRSQVKAVVDYTWNGHPVSFDDRSRSVYTLSDAVADVWRINEAKWAKVPGTFATERDLRAACYNIAEKADGGVSFNFRR